MVVLVALAGQAGLGHARHTVEGIVADGGDSAANAVGGRVAGDGDCAGAGFAFLHQVAGVVVDHGADQGAVGAACAQVGQLMGAVVVGEDGGLRGNGCDADVRAVGGAASGK